MPLPGRTGSPVSEAQLAAMRAQTTATLPDVCDVQTPTQVFNDAGGWDNVYATRATLPCRVWPAGRVQPNEQIFAERLQGRSAVAVSLPAVYPDGGADAGELIEVGRSERVVRHGDATALEVLGDASARTWRTETRLICARVS